MVVESKHHAMSWEDKILHQFQLLESPYTVLIADLTLML